MYFNNHAFQKHHQEYSHYIDRKTGEVYWISNIKRRESNRHQAGKRVVMIDSRIGDEYKEMTGLSTLPISQFEIVGIEENFPVSRINNTLNRLKEE